MKTNPFKILPVFIILQIAAGLTLGTPSTVKFPESDTQLKVEVAESEAERKKGLMYREELPIDRGMLFVFPREEEQGFWMKNTLIPLDMIFVSEEGKIVNIEEAVPEPDVADENLTIYRSDGPAKYVIETNASFVERHGIEAGDRVEIPEKYR